MPRNARACRFAGLLELSVRFCRAFLRQPCELSRKRNADSRRCFAKSAEGVKGKLCSGIIVSLASFKAISGNEVSRVADRVLVSTNAFLGSFRLRPSRPSGRYFVRGHKRVCRYKSDRRTGKRSPSRVVLSLKVRLSLQVRRCELTAAFHGRPNEQAVQYHHARSNSVPTNSLHRRAIPQSL